MKNSLFVVKIGLILALLANSIWLHSQIAGFPLLLAYLAVFGWSLGERAWPSLTLPERSIFGIFGLTSVYALTLSLVFYIFKLPSITYAIVFALMSAVITYLTKSQQFKKFNFQKPSLENLYLGFGYYFFTIVSFIFLFKSRTVEITSSPWQSVTPHFFFSLVLAIIFLWLLNKGSKSDWSFLNLAPLIILILNVGNIVYPLGFGYDPFIHQATEKLLSTTGTIHPKPLAYVGHYVLVTFLNSLSGIKLELIDRLLPSLMAAIILPSIIFLSAKKFLTGFSSNAILIIFVLPFALLANPTPQALSLIYVIAAIFIWTLIKSGAVTLWQYAIVVLTAVLIHPLAGIPALMMLIYSVKEKYVSGKMFKFAKVLMFLAFSIAYPLAFWLMNFLSANKTTFGWYGLSLGSLIPFNFQSRFIYPLDLAYIAGNLSYVAVFSLAIAGIYIIYQKKSATQLFNYLALFLILIINVILLISFVRFGNIASYEQLDFAKRIIQIAFYALIPLALYLIGNIKLTDGYKKFFAGLCVVTVIISVVYLSYPRFDDYQNSSFQNLSQYDIKAVREIEVRHHNERYVVLANQMTSAAAIKEFGLDRNVQTISGDWVYFYPIPTGGALYQFYLPVLNESDTAKIIGQIKEYAKTERVIITVSRNWKRFEEINKKLAASAASSYSIDDRMFVYEF